MKTEVSPFQEWISFCLLFYFSLRRRSLWIHFSSVSPPPPPPPSSFFLSFYFFWRIYTMKKSLIFQPTSEGAKRRGNVRWPLKSNKYISQVNKVWFLSGRSLHFLLRCSRRIHTQGKKNYYCSNERETAEEEKKTMTRTTMMRNGEGKKLIIM